jgi:quercetin dioxygenase-like cupin family protein
MKAVVVAPGEGRFIALDLTGAGVTIKASDAETGGLCSVWEGRVLPGTVGAAPHYHRGRDELFYVLQGEIELRIGEETHTAGAGTFAFVPRETIHGFHNGAPKARPFWSCIIPRASNAFSKKCNSLRIGTDPARRRPSLPPASTCSPRRRLSTARACLGVR